MAVPLRPRGHMPDDGYNSGIGRGSDHCMRCNHPMGFHSSSQNNMSVKCHLDGCSCNVTYEEAMDRAAEIRGDTEQLKYNARTKMEKLARQLTDENEHYVRSGDEARMRSLQAQLDDQRRRYEALLEQATRAETMRIRPIIVTTDRTNRAAVPGQMWIDNEPFEIAQGVYGEIVPGEEQPKKTQKSKVVKPEPPHRRVVKLPGKRGQ